MAPQDNIPDERPVKALLERIRQGDRSAWEEFYRDYHDRLLLSIRMNLGARLREHLESEDILQSVALEALRDLPRLRSDHPAALRRFLHTMVLNKIRDRADTFNAAKRAGDVPLTDSILATRTTGSEPLCYHDAPIYERLQRCLESLPGEMRHIIVMRRVDGLSGRETAERLGKSDAATRKLYSRALARLTTLMLAEESRDS